MGQDPVTAKHKSLYNVMGLPRINGGGAPTEIWAQFTQAALKGKPASEFDLELQEGADVVETPTQEPSFVPPEDTEGEDNGGTTDGGQDTGGQTDGGTTGDTTTTGGTTGDTTTGGTTGDTTTTGGTTGDTTTTGGTTGDTTTTGGTTGDTTTGGTTTGTTGGTTAGGGPPTTQ